MEESLAASRRTICSRWPSAVAGRTETAILYLPLACWLHAATTLGVAWLLSGLMYQLIVVTPEPEPPQAVSPVDAINAAMVRTADRVRERGRWYRLPSNDLLLSDDRAC